MPKPKNVTADELDRITNEVAFNLLQDVSDIAGRMEKGYVDSDAADYLTLASLFASFARTTAHFSVVLINRARFVDQKAELERLRAARDRQD